MTAGSHQRQLERRHARRLHGLETCALGGADHDQCEVHDVFSSTRQTNTTIQLEGMREYNSKACGHTTRRHAGIQLEGMRDHLHKSNDPRQTDRVPPVSFLVIRTANPKQRILSDGGCETLAKNDNPAVLPAHELYAAGSTTRCCAHGHVSSTTGMPRSATLLKKYGKAACTILLLKGTFAVVPSLRSQSM